MVVNKPYPSSSNTILKSKKVFVKSENDEPVPVYIDEDEDDTEKEELEDLNKYVVKKIFIIAYFLLFLTNFYVSVFYRYYSGMYAKPTTKKHKTWDEDGFVIIAGNNVVLKDTDGNVIESSSKIKLTEEMISECKPFRLGSKEVQVFY